VFSLLKRSPKEQNGRFFQSDCLGFNPAKSFLMDQRQGKIYQLTINA